MLITREEMERVGENDDVNNEVHQVVAVTSIRKKCCQPV